LYRSLRTGALAFALMASLFGVASAETSTVTTETTVTTAPVASVAADAEVAATEPAAPTAGADLTMWNAAPEAVAQEKKSIDRLSPVRRFAHAIVARSSALASSLTRSAMRFLGTPYSFGGTSTRGFDCSGFVQHVFAMMGVHLPRTADAQYDAARKIAGTMRPGDLVFFQTYTAGVSHVGIYLGNDKFVHAASEGVMVSSLHESYWAARYLGAKRVTAD
jgi:cell wall-associated NlpC family hydrolase